MNMAVNKTGHDQASLPVDDASGRKRRGVPGGDLLNQPFLYGDPAAAYESGGFRKRENPGGVNEEIGR